MLSEGYWQIDSGHQYHFTQKVSLRCVSAKFEPVGEMCLLKCPQCEACVHQYSCSCQDSVIHWNVRKHIHMLGDVAGKRIS